MAFDFSRYSKCMVGGIFSCGLTHTAIVPLDLIKCRMQMYPSRYTGLLSGLRLLVLEEGVDVLRTGWIPTFIGYSAQGCFKFGLYEVFKDVYSSCIGYDAASRYKNYIWLGASATAEVFADIALCPFEMVKVKMQTSPTVCASFVNTTKSMLKYRIESRFPFGSLKPLWSRQIPYTMAKFACFENIVQFMYTHVFTAKPRIEYDPFTQLSVTFTSGYMAGIICALISHPADNLVTQIGKAQNKGKSMYQIAKEIGLRSLFTSGLATRILMIGTLTGLQWWIFDSFKTSVGLGTSGGLIAKSS